MRKALFAVMLVAASFAGGAVANGPGLRWAQAMILDRLGGGEDAGDRNPQIVTPVGPGDPEPIPSAPVPKLDAGLPLSPARTGAGGDIDKTRGIDAKASAAAGGEPFPFPSSPTPEPSAPAPPESKPTPLDEVPARSKPSSDARIVPVKTQASDGAPAPLEPLDPLPLPLSAPNDRGPGPEPAGAAEKSQEPQWADVPGSAPAAAVAPRPFEPPGPGTPPAAADPKANVNAGEHARPSSNWTEIRRRMTTLGVSRYAIEAELSGRVRFSCVIPLAGRRAVAHQFEGEGDDELQAAEVALHRVALWRATESSGP